MEKPDIPATLRRCEEQGLDLGAARASYYLGRETLVIDQGSVFSRWQKRVFAFISRNARTATSYFALPPDRVVELGAQIRL